MTPEELPDLARYAAIPNSTSLTEIAERVAMMTGQQLHAHPWDEELWRRKNQTIRLLVAEVERLRGVVEERDREIERMALRYGMRQQAALEEGDG